MADRGVLTRKLAFRVMFAVLMVALAGLTLTLLVGTHGVGVWGYLTLGSAAALMSLDRDCLGRGLVYSKYMLDWPSPVARREARRTRR